jgi:hypothetical protein
MMVAKAEALSLTAIPVPLSSLMMQLSVGRRLLQASIHLLAKPGEIDPSLAKAPSG